MTNLAALAWFEYDGVQRKGTWVEIPVNNSIVGALMAGNRIGGAGRLAVGLAVLGGLIALVVECVRFRRSGTADWGHVALAVGVPLLMYSVIAGSQRGGSGPGST